MIKNIEYVIEHQDTNFRYFDDLKIDYSNNADIHMKKIKNKMLNSL
jgi:uncharacterized protein YneR